MTRPSTWKRRRKLRKIFSGYTQASKFPASLPKNPARVPTADKNSHGRAMRVSSRGVDSCSAAEKANTAGAATRTRVRSKFLNWGSIDLGFIRRGKESFAL